MNYDQEANKYLGVDVTESDFGMHSAPYWAHIKLPEDKYFPDTNGDLVTELNLGYFEDASVAARVFNMYAVLFYGEDAIVNYNIKRTEEHEEAWKTFICSRPNRARNYRRAHEKAKWLLNNGVKFERYIPQPKEAAPF